MTSELIPIGDSLLVWRYELQAHPGVFRPIAEVWLEDEDAGAHFYERRRFEGRLYGRVGTRRSSSEDAQRVALGEHALAVQALRQAGLSTKRVSAGRAWL